MVKIMILMGMVFSALIAVKKVLILGAFILPSIIKNIQSACHKKEEHVEVPVHSINHGWW